MLAARLKCHSAFFPWNGAVKAFAAQGWDYRWTANRVLRSRYSVASSLHFDQCGPWREFAPHGDGGATGTDEPERSEGSALPVRSQWHRDLLQRDSHISNCPSLRCRTGVILESRSEEPS